MKHYDVYVARLEPVQGSEMGKTRPVVIVSDDLRNQGFAFLATTVVVAALAVAAIAAMRSIDEVTTTGRLPAPSAA